MARKTLAALNPHMDEMVETFQAVSEFKEELARAAIDEQDKPTQKAIYAIHKILVDNATSAITDRDPDGNLCTVNVDIKYISYNFLWLAVQIVKGLALVDLRVANFNFPPSLCSNCEAELPKGGAV